MQGKQLLCLRVDGVQLPVHLGKAQRMQIVLSVPQALCRVVAEHVPRVGPIPHGQVVLSAAPAAHGIVIAHISQRLSHSGGEAPVIGAYALTGLVIQHLVHHAQAFAAAVLYAASHRFCHLMGARRADSDPVDHILFEERGVAQIVGRTCPRAVRTHGCGPRVGGDAQKSVPVLEIAQCAAVQLIHGLAVHHAVLAAPHPVLALTHIVHIRYAA